MEKWKKWLRKTLSVSQSLSSSNMSVSSDSEVASTSGESSHDLTEYLWIQLFTFWLLYCMADCGMTFRVIESYYLYFRPCQQSWRITHSDVEVERTQPVDITRYLSYICLSKYAKFSVVVCCFWVAYVSSKKWSFCSAWIRRILQNLRPCIFYCLFFGYTARIREVFPTD